MTIFNLTAKCLENVKHSTTYDQHSYGVNFDDFDILAADSSKFKLLLKEVVLTKSDNFISDRTLQPFPLEFFYSDDIFFFSLPHDCQDFLKI